MLTIELCTAEQAQAILPDLLELLRDSVDNGASVNFLPPLAMDIAERYWQRTIGELAIGTCMMLVASQDGSLAGSVQLALATQPNAPHRAEVQKLLVHTRFRKQGIGSQLLAEIEMLTLSNGRNLLVLDTERGSDAERLYRKHGYLEAGVIPKYVIVGDGSLSDTVVFYRQL